MTITRSLLKFAPIPPRWADERQQEGAVPVEFLSDDQAAAYGRSTGGFARAELERYFVLDNVDRALVQTKRRDHNRLGYAVQLATVCYVGRFLDDPLEVPGLSSERCVRRC
ncbi:DUF4158 domain-containing protein [Saccharothrix sp. S26]|uniref:DUF4158 domain-containing protein n=1 Tax=Saccharothrix sp. S26 TaxID=2907215 RepID=UPI0022776B3C|nr:DUF4158 domain-containing protein [Saccharothrix sp. S26]